MTALLELEDVACHFRVPGGLVRAVDGVSLQVQKGETYALVGESGCGKSTLAKTILRLHPLVAGTIRFDGEDVAAMRGADAKRYRSRVQAVFQDPYSSLNPRLRVRTILAEPLRAHGVARAATLRRGWNGCSVSWGCRRHPPCSTRTSSPAANASASP